MSKYTVEMVRGDPFVVHYQDLVFSFENDENWDERETLFADAFLLTVTGATVLADYNAPREYQIGEIDHNGYSMYLIPWDKITGVYTAEEYEIIQGCQEADNQLLSNAH